MAEKRQHLYDVFLVHSSDDEERARIIDQAMVSNELRTYAHYRSGDDSPQDRAGGFFVGKFVIDNISYAVQNSKCVLILVTESAVRSGWVTFEIILSLEKSLRENSMCVRLVFIDLTKEEREQFKTGDLQYIPDFILDLNDSKWQGKLVAFVKEENPELKDVLPMGNVAHGLVFNYFVGFLKNVLPALKDSIKGSSYYKDKLTMLKFVILIPTSSTILPFVKKYGSCLIEKLDGTLVITQEHGDKRRPFNIPVYSITKGNETYFFTGDCPFILQTMYKLTKFSDVGPEFLKYQVERFRKTLTELVNHCGNMKFNNTVCFVNFDDTKADSDLGEILWERVKQSIEEEATQDGGIKTVRKVGTLDPQEGDKKYFATITHQDEDKDRKTADGISDFLTEKKVNFTNGGGKMHIRILDEAKWNIFVLSKDVDKNHELVTQLNSALQRSIDEDVIQVIPIVTKDTSIKDIPEHLKCATLLEEKDDRSHLEQMWHMMTDRPRTMRESLPPGPVYQGLAYAYLVNYLVIALEGVTNAGRGFKERFEDAMKKYNLTCLCVPRVFSIIQTSCKFPHSGSQFKRETHIGELEPVYVGPRKYCLQMYKLQMKNGEEVCYAREYATPAVCLYEMAHNYPFAGMNTEDMVEQADKFVKLCKQTIQDESFKTHIGNIKDKCVFLYFDDSKEEMPDALECEIQGFLDTGEYISP